MWNLNVVRMTCTDWKIHQNLDLDLKGFECLLYIIWWLPKCTLLMYVETWKCSHSPFNSNPQSFLLKVIMKWQEVARGINKESKLEEIILTKDNPLEGWEEDAPQSLSCSMCVSDMWYAGEGCKWRCLSKNSPAHCIFAHQLKEWEWRSGQDDTAEVELELHSWNNSKF